MNKTVLVAIDGSVYSSNSLDYLIKLFGTDTKLSLHLLSVVSVGGSGQDWMYDVDPLRTQSPATEKRSRVATNYLKDAKARLLRNGFTQERITYSIKSAASSISTAIHHEANLGHFDGLVIGRRGIGMVGSMFFGSTSSELIEKIHEIPLWVIDGDITATKFLLAVHNQPDSLMAADHLSFILKDHPGAQICLYHSKNMFTNQAPAPPEAFFAQWGEDWCRQYLDMDNYLFYAHAQILMDNGIAKEQIIQLPIQMHLDVGSDLLRQAKKHECGTIVIGRRGRNTGKGLLKGVSDRTIQQAQDIAIWLVG